MGCLGPCIFSEEDPCFEKRGSRLGALLLPNFFEAFSPGSPLLVFAPRETKASGGGGDFDLFPSLGQNFIPRLRRADGKLSGSEACPLVATGENHSWNRDIF